MTTVALEDYRKESSRLSSELDQLRLEHAPAQTMADVQLALLRLHLKHQQREAARATLDELGALRHPDGPGLEATWYLCSSEVTLDEGNAPRAVWFVERAIALGRRHGFDELLAHALLQFAECLRELGREEEASWAVTEAVVCFCDARQEAHAADVIVAQQLWMPADDASVLQHAVALAEAGGSPGVACMALVQLGNWHREHREYLPARRALERALNLARTNDAPHISSCLTALTRLECTTSRHDEALRLATEALACAPDGHSKASALQARADVHAHLEAYGAARADLLEAARGVEDDRALARELRLKAREHRIGALLQRLPRWVYAPIDITGHVGGGPNHFQPLVVWLLAFSVGVFALGFWLARSGGSLLATAGGYDLMFLAGGSWVFSTVLAIRVRRGR